jgi:hypothetical protein
LAELVAERRKLANAGGKHRGAGTDRSVAAIAEGVARARIAEAEGQTAEALKHYRAAEAIETGLGYFEPPLWPTPVAVLSANLRMKTGDRAGAAADFRRALAQRPGNQLASTGLASIERG